MTLGKSLTVIGALAAITAAVVVAASTATPTVPAVASGSLSSAESSALVYMREEEKLARDVYQALAAKWSLPVFRNIARSEQQHMDAVAVLLQRYGVADPVAGKAAGEFASPAFQELYRTLVADGSRSLAAALQVGVRIEKLDIADLENRLEDVDNADVRLVFTRLEAASQNHLRAFSR